MNKQADTIGMKNKVIQAMLAWAESQNSTLMADLEQAREHNMRHIKGEREQCKQTDYCGLCDSSEGSTHAQLRNLEEVCHQVLQSKRLQEDASPQTADHTPIPVKL